MSEKLTCYVYLYIYNLWEQTPCQPTYLSVVVHVPLEEALLIGLQKVGPVDEELVATVPEEPTYYLLSKTITDFPAVKKHVVPPLAGMFSLLHL